MNILLDSLPDSVMIGGREYKINTDFRVWIKYESLLTDSSREVKLKDILRLVFPDPPPKRFREEAVNQIIWFYSCGKKAPSKGGSDSSGLFSYDYDADFVYSAFMEQYRVDLTSAKMHWWQFHALMVSLSEDTELVKIMGYRAVKITSKMSAEQKRFYSQMKKRYAIPKNKEEQKRLTAIEDALLNGEAIDNLL